MFSRFTRYAAYIVMAWQLAIAASLVTQDSFSILRCAISKYPSGLVYWPNLRKSASRLGETAQEAMKLLQNTSKKDDIRVHVTGKKDGDVIHVQSMEM